MLTFVIPSVRAEYLIQGETHRRQLAALKQTGQRSAQVILTYVQIRQTRQIIKRVAGEVAVKRVGVHVQLLQPSQVFKRPERRRNAIAAQIQNHQATQWQQRWYRRDLVALQDEVVQRHEQAEGRGNGRDGIAGQVEGGQARQVADARGEAGEFVGGQVQYFETLSIESQVKISRRIPNQDRWRQMCLLCRYRHVAKHAGHITRQGVAGAEIDFLQGRQLRQGEWDGS